MGDVKLLQTLRMAIGYKQQSALATALVAADMISLRHTSAEAPQVQFLTESDAADFGKGIYPTQNFKKNRDVNFPLAGRLTSEWGAILSTFGLGKTTKTAAGTGWKYTSTQYNPNTDGLAMPVTTILAQIGSGVGAILDKAIIGCACEEFAISAKSGAGRDNSTFTSTWVGTGRSASPSSIVMPAFATEHALNAGGISALTINGINYLTANRFVTLDFGWKNNLRLDSGFHPGSGEQDGFQVRGRMRRGVPAITLKATVEAETGSAEEANLINQVEGTAVITFDGAQIGAGPEKHQFKITCHRVVPITNPIGENEGIATYGVEVQILEHASNGVITIEATCEQNNVLAIAS